MSVQLMIFLFGKPGQELDEGSEVTAKELRELGKNLHARLDEAANNVEKLTNAGWQAEMTLYDIILSHPYLNTVAAVEEQLEKLGIDPETVTIDDWDDEEEEEEEEGEMDDLEDEPEGD
jgi:hypothetical protein